MIYLFLSFCYLLLGILAFTMLVISDKRQPNAEKVDRDGIKVVFWVCLFLWPFVGLFGILTTLAKRLSKFNPIEIAYKYLEKK